MHDAFSVSATRFLRCTSLSSFVVAAGRLDLIIRTEAHVLVLSLRLRGVISEGTETGLCGGGKSEGGAAGAARGRRVGCTMSSSHGVAAIFGDRRRAT